MSIGSVTSSTQYSGTRRDKTSKLSKLILNGNSSEDISHSKLRTEIDGIEDIHTLYA